MIYLLSILFTLIFVLYTKYQFIDDRGGPSGNWHKYGAGMRIAMFAIPFILQFFPGTWQDYLLSGSINIMLWEVLINKIALNVDWFYLGTTSKIDIKFSKIKWILYTAFIIISLFIKIFVH